MTRTVRDAALMLDAIAGPDDRDRYSMPADAGPSFLESCDAGIAGLSVAWSADLGHAHRRSRGPRSLRPGGGALRVARLPRGSRDADLGQSRRGVSRAGGGRDACRLGEPPRRRRGAARPEPRRAPALRARDHDRAVHARVTRAPRPLDRRAALPRALRPPHHADGGGAAVRGRTARRQGDRGPRGRPARLDRRSRYPFNLTGQPAATVPVGFTASGLPVGLQIVGRRHGDRTVLAASAAFEAAAPWADSKPRLD